MNTIYKVCGGRWGGTKVDDSFLKLLDQVIGSEKMEHFKNEGRSEFLEFLRGFELKKRTFNKDSMKRVVLKIPPALVDILSEKSGEKFEEKFKTLEQNKALSFSGDKLNITIPYLHLFSRVR